MGGHGSASKKKSGGGKSKKTIVSLSDLKRGVDENNINVGANQIREKLKSVPVGTKYSFPKYDYHDHVMTYEKTSKTDWKMSWGDTRDPYKYWSTTRHENSIGSELYNEIFVYEN